MARNFALIAYGWLALSGVLHFAIDVVAQFIRGTRPPGAETTLYYGLNTAFACGQVSFGLLCLWLVWRVPAVALQWPVTVLALVAAAIWLAITFLFIGYWEPRFNAVVFAVFMTIVAMTAA